MGVGRGLRVGWATLGLVLVESLVFGLASLPGLLTYRAILNMSRELPATPWFVETALLGVAFVPAYFVFCVALMFFSAWATRIMRWRATPGSFDTRTAPWTVVRWAQYNASIHVVRLFAGGVLRATPLWTWYIKLNGARVGQNVHINTLSIFDHNLLAFGDGVVIGSDVKISAHSGAKGRIVVSPVALGRNVTVGTNSVVYPGVVVGDNTQVGAMSVVLKDTVLPPDCIFAGVPVRLVRRAGERDRVDVDGLRDGNPTRDEESHIDSIRVP